MTKREKAARRTRDQIVDNSVQRHFKNFHNRSPKPFRRLMASLAYIQLRAWGYNV